jgi:ribonuclease Z
MKNVGAKNFSPLHFFYLCIMENFELQILGCGSASPSKINNQSSQILTLRGKQFMIDCGEGTQNQLRKFNVKTNRLNHIFISHLHGDHTFGLIGLISTFGMHGRTAELCIHSPAGLENLLKPQIDFYCKDLTYKVSFISTEPRKHQLIYSDRTVDIYSIPLKHRVPCCGFLFSEKPKQRHIIKEMIDFYNIPVKNIAAIKEGNDFVTSDGEIIPNDRLTREPAPPKKYAYCSDTAYYEKIIPIIEGVDCLFHEATFLQSDIVRAAETGHSSALQAAQIAAKANVKKLIIGHFSARYTDQNLLLQEAKSIFQNTSLGFDGMKTDI